MSDRYSGHIQIGGKIKKNLTGEFVKLVQESGASFNWDESGSLEDITTKELQAQASIDTDKVLELFDDQARYGQFEDLEKWLVKNKIQFQRYSEAYCEYNAEIYYYRPELGDPITVLCDTDGNELTMMEYVKKIRESLLKGQGYYNETLELVNKIIGPDIPPLPDFELEI